MSNKPTKTQKPTELKDTELDEAAGGFSFGVEREMVKKPGDEKTGYMKIEMEK